MAEPRRRTLSAVHEAGRLLEGGGFPVRRPFPSAALPQVDPFLLLDEMGPVTWKPGEAIGAPDHPHRGFETVTYLLRGRMEHRDSAGHRGALDPGAVQWMTAGAGVVHSEMPHPEFLAAGGTMHGFQLWVNLPRRDKMLPPRYQDVPAGGVPTGATADGRVAARVIAGEAMGVRAAVQTALPVTYVHFSIQPGGRAVQPVPADHKAMAYVFSGSCLVGDGQVGDGQLAVLGDGDAVELSVPDGAAAAAELLVLAGPPLGEPIARRGPFVMNTPEEIRRAVEDFQAGRMGAIDRA